MWQHRAVLVVVLLTLASLACYSNSPLWPYELTPAAPTVTPLPTANAGQARFLNGDLAWVPTSLTEAAFRLDLTTVPEPLKPDLSNKSPQSCSQNTQVQILYNGVHNNGTLYYLIDCNGVVGWTTEDRLLGPIQLGVNQRALTTEGGLDPASNAYKIESSDPPYREDDPFRQKTDCRVNDTVDVVAMFGLSTGELYYKIRCTNPFNPVVPNIGWVTPQALFGPVRFRNGETGLVPLGVGQIELASQAEGGEIVGTCSEGALVAITATPVQRIDDELFYEMTCDQVTGWANQELVVGPVPYQIGQQVMVTAPGVSNSAESSAEASPDATPSASDVTAEAVADPAPLSEPPSVPLTADPGLPTPTNQLVRCPDASILTIQALAGVDDHLFAQVECDGQTGWIDMANVFGVVDYPLGATVLLGESALIGFGERGIYLSINLFDIEGSSGGSRVIAGDCAIDFTSLTPIPATLVEVGYYRTSTGAIAGIFYRAQCQNAEGATIEGWLNQDRIMGLAGETTDG